VKSKLFLIFALIFVASTAHGEFRFNLDFYQRTRYEVLESLFLDANGYSRRHYVRFKTSLGARATYGANLFARLKLTNENRTYIYRTHGSAAYNIDEVVIDNFYIGYQNIRISPNTKLDIKIGRFNLPASEYGEGFLIAEGTPLDGSRTFYFNAAKARFRQNNSSLDIIAVTNTRTDYLPVFNRRANKYLNFGRENALIVYARTQHNKRIHAQYYYIYKTEEVTNRLLPLSSRLHTLGFFVRTDFNDMALRLQAAGQFGNYGSNIRRGFGAYGFADFFNKWIFSKITTGMVYLSGDNPNSQSVTGWNPLFSRYPWKSNLICHLFLDEGGIGYWSNIKMYTINANINILRNLNMLLGYSFVYANELAIGSNFSNGKHRGNVAQCKFNWHINNRINVIFDIEHMRRGNFYANRRDAFYARLEGVFRI